MDKRKKLPLSEGGKRIRTILPGLVKALEKDLEEKAYGFVFYEEIQEKSLFAANIESSSSSLDRGVVLRLLYNGKNYERASNILEEGTLFSLAEELNREIKALEAEPFLIPPYKPKSWKEEDRATLCEIIREAIPREADPDREVHFGVMTEINPMDLSTPQLMAHARELREKAIAADEKYCREKGTSPLAMIFVSYRFRLISHIFVDREKNMSQTLPVSMGVLSGQTVKGKTNRAILGGMGGMETFHFGEEEKEAAVEIPHRLDEAQRLKPGTYPVITGPDITGVFAHEAFGHTQEGDTCLQGRSITSLLKGKQVGNDQATIINNAAVFSMEHKNYGTNGSYFFDHEGELAREIKILDNGILSPPMTDLLTSLHLGIRRTANGKRESWRRPTLTRQTNTYFTAGDKTLEELLEMSGGRCFLATRAHGGMEDPKGANLTAGAEYFMEILDGKLTGKLFVGPKGGHIELSGYVPDLLNGITAKSKVYYDTPEPDPVVIPDNKIGGCGKFHKELVPAGCGGPYILWAKVTCG